MTPRSNAWIGIGLGLIMAITLPGCNKIKDTVSNMARSKLGQGVVCGGGGMVTGAAVYFGCNAITGKKAECAIGAAAAALADALYCLWTLSRKIVSDYDDTVKTLHYDIAQGVILKILDFDVDQKIVRPGDEIKIRVKYALMSPSSTEEIKVEEKFTLPNDKKPRIETMTRQPGTWGADKDFAVKIDNSTPEGKVELILELKLVDRAGKQAQDRRALCFNVTRSGNTPKPQLCPSADNTRGIEGTFIVGKGSRKISILDAPKKKSRVLTQAMANERFSIIDKKRQGGIMWYKIQLEDGREGWAPASAGMVEK